MTQLAQYVPGNTQSAQSTRTNDVAYNLFAPNREVSRGQGLAVFSLGGRSILLGTGLSYDMDLELVYGDD